MSSQVVITGTGQPLQQTVISQQPHVQTVQGAVIHTNQIQTVPGAVVQTVPGPVVHTSPVNNNTYLDDSYNDKQSFVLGILEVVAGGLCVLFNIVALAAPDHVTYVGGPGFWTAFWFILGGTFGILAGRAKRRSFINASLGLNIVANVFAFILFVWTCVAVGIDDNSDSVYFYYSTYQSSEDRSLNLAMGSLLMLLAITIFVTSTWLYVLGCKSCCRPRTMTTTTVITTHGQPMVQQGYGQQPYYPQPYVAQPQQFVGQPQQQYVGQPQQPQQYNQGFQAAPLAAAPPQQAPQAQAPPAYEPLKFDNTKG